MNMNESKIQKSHQIKKASVNRLLTFINTRTYNFTCHQKHLSLHQDQELRQPD